MGVFHYDGRGFPMEDRLLAHLQVLISLKLRRGENFFLTWLDAPAAGSGRYSVWVDNGVPILFEFENSRIPAINREWIETLTASAGTNFGLQVTPEGELEAVSIPEETDRSVAGSEAPAANLPRVRVKP